MPTEPRKPLIVISYAHADEPERPAEGEVKWLSFVTGYLRPATQRLIEQSGVDIYPTETKFSGLDPEPS